MKQTNSSFFFIFIFIFVAVVMFLLYGDENVSILEERKAKQKKISKTRKKNKMKKYDIRFCMSALLLAFKIFLSTDDMCKTMHAYRTPCSIWSYKNEILKNNNHDCVFNKKKERE